MPRTSNRGGARTGTPGKSYANRTDLNQAVTVAPSQQYGQGAQQAAAQKAIPLPNNAAQLAQMTQAAGQPSPTPQPPAPLPGDHGAFNRPTELPNQPVTAGLPFGPGPGPEALVGNAPRQASIAESLGQMAQMTGNPDIALLASRAQAQRTQ